MSKSDNNFIRLRGTNQYAKFRPTDPNNPSSPGTYVLSEGLPGAAVFSYIHAVSFINGLRHEHDLEMVDAFTEIQKQNGKHRN